MNSKKKRLCLCSKCKILSHKEGTVDKPGQLVDLRKWKEHAANDELRAAEEDHLLYTALVTATAALKEEPQPGQAQDIEVRGVVSVACFI